MLLHHSVYVMPLLALLEGREQLLCAFPLCWTSNLHEAFSEHTRNITNCSIAFHYVRINIYWLGRLIAVADTCGVMIYFMKLTSFRGHSYVTYIPPEETRLLLEIVEMLTNRLVFSYFTNIFHLNEKIKTKQRVKKWIFTNSWREKTRLSGSHSSVAVCVLLSWWRHIDVLL